MKKNSKEKEQISYQSLVDLETDLVRLREGSDLLAWTVVNRDQLRPSVFLDMRDHQYMVEMYRDRSRKIAAMKAGQVGVSEWLVSWALHAVLRREMDILYLLPTGEVASDFDRTRITTAFECSPALAAALVPERNESRPNRVGLKRIGNHYLYLRAASIRKDARSPKLKSVPVDGWAGDEYDELDPRAPELARKRMGHSSHQEERVVSTPTYVGMGIDAIWGTTSQKLWHLHCEHCGNWQNPTIDDVVREWDNLHRPASWWGQEAGRAWIACRRCGKPLDRRGEGRWVETWRDREWVGYHITKLIAPYTSIDEIIENLRSFDQSVVKESWNQDLGLPYSPIGSGLTPAVLDKCIRTGELQRQGAVMGIDVGLLLHVVIRGLPDPETGERRLLFADTLKRFEDVPRLLQAYNVRTCVIDALPETRKARELQASVRLGLVWLAIYAEQQHGKALANWKVESGEVVADRTRSLDEMVARFASEENTLPPSARHIASYYSQLGAITRVTESGALNVTAKWVQSGPDHYAHAENYCSIASHRPAVFAPLVQGVARRKLP